MFRMLIKVMLFPVMILLFLCETICTVVTSVSGFIFNLIAGIFILTAILSYGFGLESWPTAAQMVIAGVLFIMLPLIGTVLGAGFALLNAWIRTI